MNWKKINILMLLVVGLIFYAAVSSGYCDRDDQKSATFERATNNDLAKVLGNKTAPSPRKHYQQNKHRLPVGAIRLEGLSAQITQVQGPHHQKMGWFVDPPVPLRAHDRSRRLSFAPIQHLQIVVPEELTPGVLSQMRSLVTTIQRQAAGLKVELIRYEIGKSVALSHRKLSGMLGICELLAENFPFNMDQSRFSSCVSRVAHHTKMELPTRQITLPDEALPGVALETLTQLLSPTPQTSVVILGSWSRSQILGSAATFPHAHFTFINPTTSRANATNTPPLPTRRSIAVLEGAIDDQWSESFLFRRRLGHAPQSKILAQRPYDLVPRELTCGHTAFFSLLFAWYTIGSLLMLLFWLYRRAINSKRS